MTQNRRLNLSRSQGTEEIERFSARQKPSTVTASHGDQAEQLTGRVCPPRCGQGFLLAELTGCPQEVR